MSIGCDLATWGKLILTLPLRMLGKKARKLTSVLTKGIKSVKLCVLNKRVIRSKSPCF